jgi:hypothetical protein
MRTRAIQLLTFALCLTLAGGAQACLCERLQRIAAEKADAHACCPAHSTPISKQHCHDCDLIAAVPNAATSAPATELGALSTSPIAPNSLGATLATRSQSPITDDVPIPPNLRDLHHLFTQLTE